MSKHRKVYRQVNNYWGIYWEPKPQIPSYSAFTYELTDEEKEEYKDLNDYLIKDIKYIESFDDETLRLAKLGMNLMGGKQRGMFVKIKKKMKQGDYFDPLILYKLIIKEMNKRNILSDISFNTDMEIIKRKEIEKYT